MEKESVDQNRSVRLILYRTQRQNSTVRKLSRLPASPGEGAASALPVLYVRAPTSRVLNPKPMRAMYTVRRLRTRARAEYVRRTATFWKTRVHDYYGPDSQRDPRGQMVHVLRARRHRHSQGGTHSKPRDSRQGPHTQEAG